MSIDALRAAVAAFLEAHAAELVQPVTDAARQLRAADPDEFLRCASDTQWVVRRAFAAALETPLTAGEEVALRALARADEDVSVVYAAALAAQRLPCALDVDTIRQLLDRLPGNLFEVAVALATPHLSALRHRLIEIAEQHGSWLARQLAVQALAPEGLTYFARLCAVLAGDSDNDVRDASARVLTAALHTARASGQPLPVVELATLRRCQAVEGNLTQHPALSEWIAEQLRTRADVATLRQIGTILSDEAREGQLPRAFGISAIVDTVIDALRRDSGTPAAVLLVGPRGVGKTAIVHEVVDRLLLIERRPVEVVRITGSELVAGAQYIGIWENRVGELVAAAAAPRPVVLYTPSLVDLATAGRSSKGDNNVAAILADHLERGTIAMIAECTPDAYRHLLAHDPGIVRRFTVLQVAPPSREATRAIVTAVIDEAGVSLEGGVADRLVELSDEYLVNEVQPGAAIGLLRRVLRDVPDRDPTVADVLATLSQATGVPPAYLDDAVPLDRADVRAALEHQVMGQPDAIDAVLERLALIKAGLTDPGKPFAVLLFVGPTGVGKTALAQAVAAQLFGDASRLIRIDMSEYATFDSFERLLGTPQRPGVLTAPVRARPFSVVLLDEIEKAHVNAFDLCLQLFDAGRLTDGSGETVDFRRTVIILTSNIGAGSAPPARALGFGASDRSESVDLDAHTDAALGGVFRPEFINRIDRVVRFVPLNTHVLADIARRELRRVLDRSGLTRRRITLDIDESLVTLLLQQGYSPAYGARPLKRTIEQRVLQPVAWALAEGRVPPGSTLRLVAQRGQVVVKAVAVDPVDDAADRAEQLEESIGELRVRGHAMLEIIAELAEASAPLLARLSEAVVHSSQPGFYHDSSAARRILDEIYRLDGAKRAVDEVRRDVEELNERLARRPRDARDIAAQARRVRATEGRLAHVRFLASCADVAQLTDAYVTITRAGRTADDLDGVRSIARMYRGLAGRRGLECDVVDDRLAVRGDDVTVTLLISGAGAHALLANESGEHLFVRGRHGRRSARELVRVSVLPAPTAIPALPDADVTVGVRRVTRRRGGLLEEITLEVDLVHRPTMHVLRAWCGGTRDEALERLVPLLAARVQLAKQGESGDDRRVRRYQVGPAVRVRDARTGITTARLDRVLAGEIDELVGAPLPPSF